jgi:trigger factor
MSVVLERGEGLACILKVQLPEGSLGSKVDRRIQEIASSANLKGFRRGKVPAAHIHTMYGTSIRAEVVEALAKETLQAALTQHQLVPLDQPKLELSDLAKDPVSYVATFESKPQLKIVDLAKLVVQEPQVTLGKPDIAEALEKIREHFATYEEVKGRASKLGDRLMVDYLSMGGERNDQQPIMENQALLLGKHQLPKAFDTYLVGKFMGDTVTVLLPPDVVSKKEKKKAVECLVRIRRVDQVILPELDAAFAKQLGVSGHDREAFEKEAVKPLLREVEQLKIRLVKKRLYDALLSANKVPISLSLFKQNLLDLSKNADKKEQERLLALTVKDKDPLVKQAVKLAQVNLLLMQLKEDLGVSLDEKMLLDYIEELANQYGDREQFITWFKKQEQQMNAARAYVFELQLVNAIKQKAHIKQKQTLKSMQALKACVEKEGA